MYFNEFTIIPGEDRADTPTRTPSPSSSSWLPTNVPSSQTQKPQYDIVVVGSIGAGKTALVERFSRGTFTPNSSPSDRTETTSVHDFLVTTDSWNAEHCLVDLEIQTTANERDDAIRKADGIMLLFNAADRRSFQDLEKYKIAITQMRDAENLAVTLAGNLMNVKDEVVQVTKGECVEWVKTWGSTWGIEYCQVNAADGHNVRQPFANLVSEIRRKRHIGDGT